MKGHVVHCLKILFLKKKPKQVEALHTSIIIENKIAIIFIFKMKETEHTKVI